MKISFFGAGNVAWHLAKMLNAAGIEISYIYSRHIENAKSLADEVQAVAIDKVADMTCKSDLYLFALSDNVVPEIAKEFADICGYTKRVAHTSGMLGIDVFKPYFDYYGSFYPLQTFKKGQKIFNTDFPFFITAEDFDFEERLFHLALKISSNVNFIKDDKRKVLHVAAVFVNNFTNYLMTIAKDIVEAEDVKFEYLYPLLKETIDKIIAGNEPQIIQTGPAVRNDAKTIQAHLDYLQKHPEHREIYRMLTEAIQNALSK